MSLICIAVFDTVENNRTWMTDATFCSLANTVDWKKHRLIVSDNGSVEETHKVYEKFKNILPLEVIYNGENLGTAKAVNRALRKRKQYEHVVKMDNDCVIHQTGWLDKLEECIEREPKIGIIGLKRTDCWEAPWVEGWFNSQLVMLNHKAGESWLVIEQARHIIGTCTLLNYNLLQAVGGFVQFGLYGFDDGLLCVRSTKAGFYNCFYPSVLIDHIDAGTTPYQQWKEQESGKVINEFHKTARGYMDGSIDIYYDPYND